MIGCVCFYNLRRNRGMNRLALEDLTEQYAHSESFRLDLSETVTPPARVVTDYRPEEIAAFREQFRPVAEQYHRRSRVMWFGVTAFFSCSIFGMLCGVVGLSEQLFMFCWVAGICSWFFFVFTAPRTPDCPACHTKLDAGFGRFCPECGSPSLCGGGWFSSPPCEACGKSMTRRKGRHYKIRAWHPLWSDVG